MQGAERMGFEVGQKAGVAAQFIFQVAAIAGGISMVSAKSYRTAIGGVVVSFIPLCGPCLGLSIPFAIWALILLLDPDVKAAFA